MRRRVLFLLLGLSFLLLFLGGCHHRSINEGPKKPIVYASFYPVVNLTEAIAEDSIELRSFMPLNQVVHQWEPSPKQMKELAKADLLIVNGANMESWLDHVERSLPNLRILKLSEEANLIQYTGAAALGDFQIMMRGSLEKERYPIIFGHTHEDYMRLAFYKDRGESEEELIYIGRKLLEETGEKVEQHHTFTVRDGGVYQIEMGHTQGEVQYEVPEEGNWTIYSDRLSENILSYSFEDRKGEKLDLEILMEGSSQGVDKITYDPHSWLSIGNAKIYLREIAEELSEMLPNQAKRFDRNRFDLVDQLTQLEYEYLEKFSHFEERDFIVIHNAFEYLAKDFGLTQHPLQSLTSIDDPSIRVISDSIRYAKDTGLKTIFYEFGQPKGVAEVISEELEGGEIRPLASMEYPLTGFGKDDLTYYELMEMNLKGLYESLERVNE